MNLATLGLGVADVRCKLAIAAVHVREAKDCVKAATAKFNQAVKEASKADRRAAREKAKADKHPKRYIPTEVP